MRIRRPWRVFLATSVLSVTLSAHNILAFVTTRPAFCRIPHHITKLSALQDVSVVNETTAVEDVRDDATTKPQRDVSSSFDPSDWQAYESTVRAVVDAGRMTKGRKDTPDDVARALAYLFDDTCILPVPTLEITTDTDFRTVMGHQRDDFLQATNMTKTQHDLAMRALTYMGDYCAKHQSPKPLIVAWHKLKEAGMVPRENCISTYMYVMSMLEEAGTVVPITELAMFHDLLYEPNEKTITLRIKSMIANEDAAGAEQLLASFPNSNGEWKRLRTYVPVLQLYCSQGDFSSALRLYRQMQQRPNVHFEPDTYALLVAALAEHGCFRTDSKPIPGVHELGFAASHGPGLFNELASEMAADILELNEASARVVYNGFVNGFFETGQRALLSDSDELVVDNTPAGSEDVVVSRVSLNDNTAICPKTRTKLQLYRLNGEQRRNVHDTLLEMAGIQYEKFISELEERFKQNMQEVSEGSDYAVRELSRFSDWLNERDGEPFTAIVDGPNVAYFGHGDIHYSQVKLVVDELERMNERPLVVMPQKYTAQRFYVNFMTQELSDKDLEVLNGLLESGKMYTVPSKCLDDYYWMLASVSNQTVADDHSEMHVPTCESNGRFPGLRPMLITNDQMRDHRWDLLEPRLFRRWCSCHIVNYDFAEFTDDEWEETRTVEFCAADFFSREIQGNPSEGDSFAWHFPVSEWDEHDRLCIRIPR